MFLSRKRIIVVPLLITIAATTPFAQTRTAAPQTVPTAKPVTHADLLRCDADEPGFAMPVRGGTKEHWQIIEPTTEWKEMKTELKKENFQVATDLYFIGVKKS